MLFRLTPASLWGRLRRRNDPVRDLEPKVVIDILRELGAYIENRRGKGGPASELPCPVADIEAALTQALREWREGPQLEAARTMFLGLDRWLLSDEDCALFVEYQNFVTRARPENVENLEWAREKLEWSRSDRGVRAAEVFSRVMVDATQKRGALLDELNRGRSAKRRP